MNKDAQNFLIRNGIDIRTFSEDESHIYTPKEINRIVDRYLLPSSYEFARISVGDILGYDRYSQTPESIFESLPTYFDSEGDGYHRRSIEMLDYTSEEIIDGLTESFKREPIRVREMEPGKFIINGNGLHRYTLLRIHYLQEISKATDDSTRDSIKKKYTIPVEANFTDYKKTYLRYLIESSPFCQSQVRPEIDDNYKYTGRVEISINNENRVLNDEEFLEFVKCCDLSYFNITSIEQAAKEYDSFKDFLITYFPEIYAMCSKETKGEKL